MNKNIQILLSSIFISIAYLITTVFILRHNDNIVASLIGAGVTFIVSFLLFKLYFILKKNKNKKA